jgi:hypothetical protein
MIGRPNRVYEVLAGRRPPPTRYSWHLTAGTLFFIRIAAWAGGRSPAAMLGGMFGGMVWGMVASVSMYRLWYRIIARPTDAARGR